MISSPSQKQVLIIASYAPSLLNFRGSLLRDLLKAGHLVSVAAPNVDCILRAKLEKTGVKVHETPLRRNSFSVRNDLLYCWSLFRLMRQTMPDIVLTYTIKPNIWGAFAAKRAGIRSFSLVTGLGLAFSGFGPRSGLRARVIGNVARLLYRKAAEFNEKMIFQNPDDREDFILLGCLRDKCKAALVDGSGVDLEHYARAPVVYSPVFLMIARLLVSKGVNEYADAVKQLRTRHPNARCLLVGPHDGGPDAVNPDLIERWQTENSVEYLGSAEDVRPLIAQSAVYVLPSYREGTPRSVLEAMAMGRPIVTTDAPGCRETVIEGENGFLVPVRDSSALSEAMAKFVEDPSLIETMGRKSYEVARKRYDVHKVNASMLKIMGLK